MAYELRRHFGVPRDSALVNPVDRLGRELRHNACFGTRMCIVGFREMNISVVTH